MIYRLIAVTAAIVALEGCASQPPPAPVSGEDFNIGIARSCTFTPAQPVAGGSVSSTITMTNDGWCAFRAKETDGQPFQSGLVKQRPEHGTILLQKLGGESRIEYTPSPGFVGTDNFTAVLRPKAGGADATVQVAVNVSRGAGIVAAPPPPAAASAPARRSSGSTR